MSRYENRGLGRDKALLRQLASGLAMGNTEAERVRARIFSEVGNEAPRTGGVAAWLLRSPLVGADLDLSRPCVEPRDIDL